MRISHLGDGFDQPSAAFGDLRQRPTDCDPHDALAAVALVDEAAGDAPSWCRWRLLPVAARVLDVRELLDAAVLTPALRLAVLVEHERGVRLVGADQFLFG